MLTALKIIAACAALPAAAIAYSFFERRAQRRDWDEATRRAAEIMAIGRARREHHANETGNLGKGLPSGPDNVPENENIGPATGVCRTDPRHQPQPPFSVAPETVRDIEQASYPAEALEFFQPADPARTSHAQAEGCTSFQPQSPSNSRQGD